MIPTPPCARLRGALALVVCLGACSARPRTELILAIGTDLVPSLTSDPIQCMSLTVYRSSDSAKLDARAFQVGTTDAPCTLDKTTPVTRLADSPVGRYYAVYTSDSTGPSVRIDLAGTTHDGLAITRSAVVSLAVGQTQFMRMLLLGSCLGNSCPGTCIDGACRPILFNHAIPPYASGMEGTLDCADAKMLSIDLPGYTRTSTDCASAVYTQCIEGTCYGAASTCHDGQRDGDETDVDCGGSCSPCPDNGGCNTDDDCESGYCDTSVSRCAPPKGCDDGVQDGLETDVDCGGNCPNKCDVGKRCQIACSGKTEPRDGGVRDAGPRDAGVADMAAGGENACGQPVAAGATTPACPASMSCVDGVCCPSNGVVCSGNANCGSGMCNASGVCAEATGPGSTCSDKVRDRFETDVDCGGPECKACGDYHSCGTSGYPGRDGDDDCTSGHCCAAGDADCANLGVPVGVCLPASCVDQRKDEDETDVDCGGAVCPPCADMLRCLVGRDCVDGVCGSGTCQAPTCNDCVKNGFETDVDCGGDICLKRCALGQSCLGDGDCAATPGQPLFCNGGRCSIAPVPVDMQ